MIHEQTRFDFGFVAVECFLGCGYSVLGADPEDAHDEMERHYETEHAATIDALVSEVLA